MDISAMEGFAMEVTILGGTGMDSGTGKGTGTGV